MNEGLGELRCRRHFLVYQLYKSPGVLSSLLGTAWKMTMRITRDYNDSWLTDSPPPSVQSGIE